MLNEGQHLIVIEDQFAARPEPYVGQSKRNQPLTYGPDRAADELSYFSDADWFPESVAVWFRRRKGFGHCCGQFCPRRTFDILKNAKQPMFLVCVSDQVRRLDEIPKKPNRSEGILAKRARAAV